MIIKRMKAQFSEYDPASPNCEEDVAWCVQYWQNTEEGLAKKTDEQLEDLEQLFLVIPELRFSTDTRTTTSHRVSRDCAFQKADIE